MKNSFFLIFCVLFFVSCQFKNRPATTAENNNIIVFQPNQQYTSMRIPALVATQKGTLIAFCEGRIGSSNDWADMNLIMRRSTDGGNHWSKISVIDSIKNAPVGNPTPIVDDKGNIHLLYQKDYAKAFHTISTDDGISWSAPTEITYVFDKFKPEYDWKVLAPGPGHGIEMKNGRLLAAVWLANSQSLTPRRSHYPSCVATIFSDNEGKTWQRGEIVADNSSEINNPNESMPVLLSDGSVLLSIRNTSAIKRRAFSISENGISNWSKTWHEPSLFDPTCMASIISIKNKKRYGLLFVNPDSKDIENNPRKNLTAKVSFDDGKTWKKKKVLHEGASGYSDLAIDQKGNIFCLFETNTGNNKEWAYSLVLKKFTPKWLLK